MLEVGVDRAGAARTSANMRQMRDIWTRKRPTGCRRMAAIILRVLQPRQGRFLTLPALLRLRVLAHVMARMGPVKFAPSETSLTHAAGLIAARAGRAHAGRVYDPLAGK